MNRPNAWLMRDDVVIVIRKQMMNQHRKNL